MSSRSAHGRPNDDDEFDVDTSQPPRRRRTHVDPEQAEELTEWSEERKRKGRKKRHDDDRDRRGRRGDEDDD